MKHQAPNDIDQIGFINKDNNIFISEYLLVNDNEKDKMSDKNLNNFFLNNFINIVINKEKNNTEIFSNDSRIGYCYRIDNSLNNNNQKIQENNSDKKGSIIKNDSTNKNLNKDKSPKEQTTSNSLEKEINKNNISEDDTKRIKIIILIYFFYQNIEKEIKKSLEYENDEEYKNKIKKAECFLIKKEWFDNFKIIFFYDKICEYIKDKDLSDIENNKDKMNNLIKDIINKVDLKSTNENNNTKLSEECNINFFISDLTQLKNENNIYYPNNFYVINSDIYKKLCKYNFINKDYKKEKEKDKKKKYIINNGQIILKYEYNIDNNENINYNIILGKLNNDKAFISEEVVFFENNKTERDSEFERFKEIRNIKYNIINNKDNSIKLYKYDNKQNITNNDNYTKRNKCIEFLLNIYIHYKQLNIKLNSSLKGASVDFYYIIKNEWINRFLEEFEYKNKFLEFIKKDNIDNIININENSLINENKVDEKILNEIINKVPSDISKEINDKINNEKIINKLSDIELYDLKSDKKKVEDETINYIDNFLIINDNIYNLLLELFKIKLKEKIKCLFGDNEFIMNPQNNLPNSIIIGYLDKDNIFKTEILLKLYDNRYIDVYFRKFSLNGYSNTINNFNLIHKKIPLLNENKIKEGTAYIIKDIENFQNIENNPKNSNKNETKENPSSSNSKIQDNFNENKNISDGKNDDDPNKKPINNNNQNNNIDKENNKEKIENNKNINNINENGITSNFNDNNNPEKIKLNNITENKIKILILYFFYFQKLKNKIKESKAKVINSKCQLIILYTKKV